MRTHICGLAVYLAFVGLFAGLLMQQSTITYAAVMGGLVFSFCFGISMYRDYKKDQEEYDVVDCN